jgi:hypothetical protein
MKEKRSLQFTWTKLRRATKTGDPSMTGKQASLKDGIRTEMNKKDSEYYMAFHCIIRLQFS